MDSVKALPSPIKQPKRKPLINLRDYIQDNFYREAFLQRYFQAEIPLPLIKEVLLSFDKICLCAYRLGTPGLIEEVIAVLPDLYTQQVYRLRAYKKRLELSESLPLPQQELWFLEAQARLLEEQVGKYAYNQEVEYIISESFIPQLPPDPQQPTSIVLSPKIETLLPAVADPLTRRLTLPGKDLELEDVLKKLLKTMTTFGFGEGLNTNGIVAITDILERLNIHGDMSFVFYSSGGYEYTYGIACKVINILESLEPYQLYNRGHQEEAELLSFRVITELTTLKSSFNTSLSLMKEAVDKLIRGIQDRMLNFYQDNLHLMMRDLKAGNLADYKELVQDTHYGSDAIVSNLNHIYSAFRNNLLSEFGLRRLLEALMYGTGTAKFINANPNSLLAKRVREYLTENRELAAFVYELQEDDRMEVILEA